MNVILAENDVNTKVDQTIILHIFKTYKGGIKSKRKVVQAYCHIDE